MTKTFPAWRRVVAVAALGLPAIASHAAATWDFQGCSSNCSGASVSDAKVNLTAFSTSGAGSTFAAASLSGPWSAQGGSQDGLGWGVQWSGESSNYGNHAVDNRNNNNTGQGSIDAVLLDFSTSASDRLEVALQSVFLSWKDTDADITVLRYTGDSAPNIAGLTTGQLVGSGWQVMGSYADLAAPTETDGAGVGNSLSNSSDPDYSSWWLVSAYSSGYGGTQVGSGWLGNGNDAFKFSGVSGSTRRVPGDTPGVPEPASFGLLAIGLVAAVGTMRRRSQFKTSV